MRVRVVCALLLVACGGDVSASPPMAASNEALAGSVAASAGRAADGVSAPVVRVASAGMGARADSAAGASAGRAADGVSAAGGRMASAGTGGRVESAAGARADVDMAADMAGRGSAGAEAMAMALCPDPPEPCRILPLGDSITFGIGYDGGYRVELFRKAVSEGKHLTFTGSVMNGPRMVEGMPFPRNNEGHSGWRIKQLEPLIPSPALEEVPHIILLMIGTNDVAQNDNLDRAPERLDALLDLLADHAPDALLVVATILPLGRASPAVMTYNAAIPALVQERADAGKRVLLVDQFAGFPTSELGDGVHPNQKGYERMAAVWYEAIRSFLR